MRTLFPLLVLLACTPPEIADTDDSGGGDTDTEPPDSGDTGSTSKQTQLAYGQSFGCLVDEGSLHCWGDNAHGQLGQGHTTVTSGAVTLPDSDWASVAPGASHACALKSDASLWCWGRNDRGQLGDGAASGQPALQPSRVGTASWAALGGGGSHTCGIQADGSLWCWGADSDGALGLEGAGDQAEPQRVGTRTDWAHVDTGGGAEGEHTCAGTDGGELWCWGSGTNGEMGDGSGSSSPDPVQVPGTWSSVVVGDGTVCAIDPADGLWCWGLSVNGQVGPGATDNQTESPVQMPTGSWTQVSTQLNHSCGVQADGSLWCWGWNDRGQLGNGAADRTPAPTPSRVGTASNWTSVAVGGNVSCALDDTGTVWCWGMSLAGQTGVPGHIDVDTPVQVAGACNVATLSVGWNHSCATRTDGTYSCWGDNGTGQLGTGDRGSRPQPWDSASTGWQAVATRYTSTCGIQDGLLQCWGRDNTGALGAPAGLETLIPVAVTSDTDWSQVVAGTSHMCGMRGGQALCWGRNTAGQSGPDTVHGEGIPTAVDANTDWTAITANANLSCGLRAGDQVWCWGGGSSSQLGNGSTYSADPVQVAGSYRQVMAAGFHTCGIQIDRTLWCWGDDSVGQILNGGATAPTPVQIGSDTDWEHLGESSDDWTCATKTDGSAWCWGNGPELAGGNTAPYPITRVPGAHTWTRLGTGLHHGCGIDDAGCAWCWGDNVRGELGDGSAGVLEPRPVPLP